MVNHGGGIYVESGSPVIRDCEFTDNTAGSGAGVYALGFSSPLIVRCHFAGNRSVGLGGAITSDENAYATIRDCDMRGNAGGDGGGICVATASARIERCTIVGNVATFGGGVDLISAYVVDIAETEITSCEAEYAGGGLYCASSVCTLTGVTLAGNVTSGEGGAGYCASSSALLAHCSILGNSAEQGGGFSIRESVVKIGDSDLAGNGVAVAVDGWLDQPVDARYNWWGDPSGPYHPLLNPRGLGDAVSDHVDFDPWNGASAVSEPEGDTPRARGRMQREPVGIKLTAETSNPTWGAIGLRLDLERTLHVTVTVYDMAGRHVVTLLDGVCGPGSRSLAWEARAPAGVYLIRLQSAVGELRTRAIRLR